MTSEIRTNSLKSRAGLSTVTLTDSGPMFSGITTFVDNSTFSVGTGGTIHAPATNTLNIGVNNTESLRIDSNSNLKVAGIVTATHFYGNGANLSGLPAGTTINNYASTRIVTATNNANELDAETNLTVNGSLITFAESTLVVNKGTNPTISTKETAGNKELQLRANTTGGLVRTVGSYPLVFGIAQVEKLRIDTSGRLLIGTTTEGNSSADNLTVADSGESGITVRSGTSNGGHIYFSDATSGTAEYQGLISYQHNGDFMKFGTAASEKLRITSDGQVLIGATSYAGGGNNPALYIRTASLNAVKIHKTGSGQSSLQLTCDGGTNPDEGDSTGFQLTQEGTSSYIMNQDDGNMYVLMDGTNTILHRANGTIRARASMGGANTATYNESVAWNSFSCNSSNGYDFKIINQNSSPAYSYSLELAAAANVNNTNYRHINCTKNSNSAGIFVVYGNGNVANANNSYGSTSDVKLKENIVDANSQWNDIKGLRVRNFNFIADSNKTKLLGLVAQEAETVCPSLVQNIKDLEEDENGNKTETGTVTKELKYSVLYMKAIKALQEAQTRIETLESKVAALEGS